jgi:hypothetical protein
VLADSSVLREFAARCRTAGTGQEEARTTR